MVFVPCHGCFANGTPATYPLYIPFHMRQSVPSKHSRKQFSQRAIMDTQMIFKQKITIKPIEFSTSKLLTFIVSIFKVRVMLRTCLEIFSTPYQLRILCRKQDVPSKECIGYNIFFTLFVADDIRKCLYKFDPPRDASYSIFVDL